MVSTYSNLKVKLKNLYLVLGYLFVIFLFLLGRTFMGFYIFNFRLGEVIIGLSFLVTLLFLLDTLKSIKNFKNYVLSENFLFLLIYLHFSFLFFKNGYQLFDLYPFKASSYIWVTGLFFMGKKLKNINTTSNFLYLLFLLLFINYFISIFGINDEFQAAIINYTDKFEYLKASDLLIYFIIFSYFLLINNSFEYNKKLSFLISFAIFYLPLFMYKSRGASIGFIIFLAFLFFEFIKNKLYKFKYIFLVPIWIILFILSVFFVSKTPPVVSEINERVETVMTGRFSTPLPEVTEVEYPFFYYEENRFYSGDGNFNWRLQIWQDVIFDLNSKNLNLTGYGYSSKIPAMEDELRAGNDGTNENVHNYFMNIYARGGLIHLTLFILIYVKVLINLYKDKNLKLFFLFIFPLLSASMFDASMENSHFPILFYFLLGNITVTTKLK